MLLKGYELGAGSLAARLAALMSDRDLLRAGGGPRERDSDVRTRLDALQRGSANVDRGALDRVRRAQRSFEQQLDSSGVPRGTNTDVEAGVLLGMAYPDRIARRRPGSEARYQLSNGRGALFVSAESIAREEFIVAAQFHPAIEKRRTESAFRYNGNHPPYPVGSIDHGRRAFYHVYRPDPLHGNLVEINGSLEAGRHRNAVEQHQDVAIPVTPYPRPCVTGRTPNLHIHPGNIIERLTNRVGIARLHVLDTDLPNNQGRRRDNFFALDDDFRQLEYVFVRPVGSRRCHMTCQQNRQH